MPDLRFGLIGAGAIAADCCHSLRGHPHAKVVAAHDLNPQRLKELCDQFQLVGCTSVEELFGKVDAVYIATPNKFHAPLALQALQAGKHVILEKPFAMNLSEARAVIAAAKAAGKTFTVGMNQRFVDGCQRLRSLVQQGALGEIYHAKAFWFRRAGIPKLGTWFGSKAMAGGGCTLDIGVHLLDLAMHLTGRFDPVSVSGAAYTKFGNRGLGEGGWGKSDKDPTAVFDVDDMSTSLIKFANGFTLQLDVTWACHMDEGNRKDVRLYGTDAGAGAYPCRVFKPHDGGYAVTENPSAPVAYAHGNRFQNFANSILSGETLCVLPAEALAVQAILDGIYASSRSGTESKIDPASYRI